MNKKEFLRATQMKAYNKAKKEYEENSRLNGVEPK